MRLCPTVVLAVYGRRSDRGRLGGGRLDLYRLCLFVEGHLRLLAGPDSPEGLVEHYVATGTEAEPKAHFVSKRPELFEPPDLQPEPLKDSVAPKIAEDADIIASS